MTDRERWNRKYRAQRLPSEPGPPARLLRSHTDLLQSHAPGCALDLACGLGRNAVFLARVGFQVEAVDVSDVAVAYLARYVRSQGLAVTVRRCDLARTSLPANSYDVIVNVNYLERALFSEMRTALRSGGLLLFETYVFRSDRSSEERINPAYVLQPGELKAEFEDWDILSYGETSKSGRQPWAVARLVARKPREDQGRDRHGLQIAPSGRTRRDVYEAGPLRGHAVVPHTVLLEIPVHGASRFRGIRFPVQPVKRMPEARFTLHGIFG